MKRIMLFSLLLIGLIFIISCAPSDLTPEEQELFGAESAVAGQAISLGCKTSTVRSCTARNATSISVTPTRGIATTYSDRCSSGVALDYSCTSPTQVSLCRTQCESTEDCVNAQCVSRCGNGVLDAGENCATCTADVLCGTGQTCQEGACVATPGTDTAWPCLNDAQCQTDLGAEYYCNSGTGTCFLPDGGNESSVQCESSGWTSYCDTLLEGETKNYRIGEDSYDVTLTMIGSNEGALRTRLTVNGNTTGSMVDDQVVLIAGRTLQVIDMFYQDYAGGVHQTTFCMG